MNSLSACKRALIGCPWWMTPPVKAPLPYLSWCQRRKKTRSKSSIRRSHSHSYTSPRSFYNKRLLLTIVRIRRACRVLPSLAAKTRHKPSCEAAGTRKEIIQCLPGLRGKIAFEAFLFTLFINLLSIIWARMCKSINIHWPPDDHKKTSDHQYLQLFTPI